MPNQDVEFLRFTEDSRGLAVLSKEPDAFLTIFYFDKSETVIVGRVSNGNQKGLTADVIACNLNDTGLVAVGGAFLVYSKPLHIEKFSFGSNRKTTQFFIFFTRKICIQTDVSTR